MGYLRYNIDKGLSYDKGMELVRELKKNDIDAEYGITENGNAIAMSPINDSEVEKMNEICKRYDITPIFVKKVNKS